MRPHILVVDDSDEVRLLAARILEREGYQVTAADSGVSALKLLETTVPDLVVSDIMMPEVDGYRLLERLREDARLAAVPVIFLSALGDATSLERGNRLGVEHYLVKPFTAKQLLAVVSGTLRRQAELRRAHQGRTTAAGGSSAHALDVEATGIGPIDDQAGGLCRGRVYVGQGGVGGGKGVLAVQFLHRALERGEGAVLVTTDRVDTVLYVGNSVGLDLQTHIRSGKLIVVGLAERFEYALETRNDVVALAAEVAAYAAECGATRIVINSILTMLCSAPRLALSAALATDLVAGLERSGAITLLLADDPVTPEEELATAYLKRTAAGAIVLSRETRGRGSGVLKLELTHDGAADDAGRAFRVTYGTGLVTVDPGATPHVYEELDELRRQGALEMAGADGEASGLASVMGGGYRLRDSFALLLRDCVTTALKATERCALVVARFSFATPEGRVVDPASAVPSPRDVERVLAGQEILCWLQPGEVAVVALGADSADGEALAGRLRDWVAALGEASGHVLHAFHVASGAYPAEGGTIDGLLESIGRTLARTDATVAVRVA